MKTQVIKYYTNEKHPGKNEFKKIISRKIDVEQEEVLKNHIQRCKKCKDTFNALLKMKESKDSKLFDAIETGNLKKVKKLIDPFLF